MSYTLIEPCCGSSAFTLHMLGASKSLLPYQGGKWRYRRELRNIAAKLGYIGLPSKIILSDPGPWGLAMNVILQNDNRNGLIYKLSQFDCVDPELLFNKLQGATIPEDIISFTAEFLFLQRLAFSGKAVGIINDSWNSPGFNKTSAYGIKATDKFGEVKPMISSLIRTLCSYQDSLQNVDFRIYNTSAVTPTEYSEDSLVYIDPPYIGATSYPNGSMTRDGLITLAETWADSGASVMISEQSRLNELSEWKSQLISPAKSDDSPFRGKQEEWVTYK